jgi:hypothetical protein
MKFDYCEIPAHPEIHNSDLKKDFDTKPIETRPGETVHVDFPAALVNALKPLSSEFNLNNEYAPVAKPTLSNTHHAAPENSTPTTQNQRSAKTSPNAQDTSDKSDSFSSSTSQNNRSYSLAPQVQTSILATSDSSFDSSPAVGQKTEALGDSSQNEKTNSTSQETRGMPYPAYGQPSRFSLDDNDNPNLFGVRSMVMTNSTEPKVVKPKPTRKKSKKKDKVKPILSIKVDLPTPKQNPDEMPNENNPSDLENWFSNTRLVAGLTLMWATGYNPPIIGGVRFTNDKVANALKNSEGVRKARDYFYNKYHGKITVGATLTDFDTTFGLKGLLFAGVDPVEQFVGTFKVEKIEVIDGNRLQYTLSNPTSFTSFLYGKGPSWEGGPMGNFRQTYVFTEPILKGKNIYNSRYCSP